MTETLDIPAPFALSAGAGEPAIIFLHGVGSDAQVWRPQLEHFGRARLALAWTMPGYGPSLPLPSHDWPGLADAVLALIDANGLGPVHLVGHSLGGMVAQEFAARHPGRLKSLVLSGTSPAFGKADGDWQKEFVRQRLAPLEAGKRMRELAPGMIEALVGPDCDPEGKDLAIASAGEVPESGFAANIRLIVTFDRRDNLPNLGSIPVLCLAGEKDNNAPAPMMERMAAKIPGARYVCLPGLGHMANIENPAMFNTALDDFFAFVEGR